IPLARSLTTATALCGPDADARELGIIVTTDLFTLSGGSPYGELVIPSIEPPGRQAKERGNEPSRDSQTLAPGDLRQLCHAHFRPLGLRQQVIAEHSRHQR